MASWTPFSKQRSRNNLPADIDSGVDESVDKSSKKQLSFGLPMVMAAQCRECMERRARVEMMEARWFFSKICLQVVLIILLRCNQLATSLVKEEQAQAKQVISVRSFLINHFVQCSPAQAMKNIFSDLFPFIA